jgi:hypothetical protein
MQFLNKLLRQSPKDPYWDRFINGKPNDPLNETSEAYRTADAGNVYPVKTEIPEPPRMAHDLAELAVFLGAAALAVAPTNAAALLPFDGKSDGTGDLPFTLMIAVPADADPEKSPGIGGQHARRVSAMVNHGVASYIRELGYQAIVCPVGADPTAAAGLARPLKSFVGDAVLTDLPVSLGPQEV